MNTKTYSLWITAFLLSISWYFINLGLMEILRAEPRTIVGVFFIAFTLMLWIFFWQTKIKTAILGEITSKSKRLLYVAVTTILLWYFAWYEMYFLIKEASFPHPLGSFFVWRAWMSYIGLLLVVISTVINYFFVVIKKNKS